jgi:hypothetical protein
MRLMMSVLSLQSEASLYAISKPLDRDRAVDETGNQVSVMGRLGSRPFNLEEMRRMFISKQGKVWTVE